MSLVNIQNLLASLYTDSKLREDFFIDPNQIAKQFDLSEIEVENVARLAQSQIDGFSHSLIQKRLNEIRKKLFLTSIALGRQFNPLFFRFARQIKSNVTKKYIEDCIQFSQFIELIAHDEKIKPWVLELIRYEIARIKTVYSKFGLKVCFFRYGIKDLIVDMMQNESYSEPKLKMTVGIWMRVLQNGKLWHRLYQI